MSTTNVTIHESQFPEAVRRDLLESLRTRCVNHKFHYDSLKQTRKWLALHEAFSPARNDADCLDTYDWAFKKTAGRISAGPVHVIGLGCGGGQKDTRLLELLKASSREIFYTPCDVSVPMTLVARQTALSVVLAQNCFPFVCDLATANDLPAALAVRHTSLVTFFGMIPNFEPEIILPKLAALVPPGNSMLFSANLAPGEDYAAGVKRILPQYDNPLTRDWLLTFLFDLGIEKSDGELVFTIEPDATSLLRVMARFHFSRNRNVAVGSETFQFHAGEAIQLFFSYRHTPETVRRILAPHGLEVCEQWLSRTQEEGVFLCRRRQ